MAVSSAGQHMYMSRAVDSEGEAPDLLAQRRRERKMQGFKSPNSARCFASVHAAVDNAFNAQRRLVSRSTHRRFRAGAESDWGNATTAAA